MPKVKVELTTEEKSLVRSLKSFVKSLDHLLEYEVIDHGEHMSLKARAKRALYQLDRQMPPPRLAPKSWKKARK